jgi:hypothetical protein
MRSNKGILYMQYGEFGIILNPGARGAKERRRPTSGSRLVVPNI